jgi:hypothetical protein
MQIRNGDETRRNNERNAAAGRDAMRCDAIYRPRHKYKGACAMRCDYTHARMHDVRHTSPHYGGGVIRASIATARAVGGAAVHSGAGGGVADPTHGS